MTFNINMKVIYKIVFLILIVLVACKGPKGLQGSPGEEGKCDRQIRIDFDFRGDAYTSTSETRRLLVPHTYLIKFNKHYYTGVDSIIFVVLLASGESEHYAMVDLFNITDNLSIANSLIHTKSTSPVWLEFVNIYDYLPDEEITLGVRLWTEHNGKMVYVYSASLFLYRD